MIKKLDITARNLFLTLTEGNRYLLLETDFIHKPAEQVDDVDFFTEKEWLWDNTFLDEHQEDGPLLVKMDEDSSLLTEYLNNWAPKNAAILLLSHYDIDKVLQHLQSIILIMKPDGNQSRLRLHEPRKLAGLFDALDEKTQSTLMGPIEHILWLENCGHDQTWYQTSNKSPHLPRHNEVRWFHFNHEHMNRLNKFEEEWFIRSLAWQIADEHKLGIEQAQQQTNTLCQQALQNGFTAEQDITEYCSLHLKHPEIVNNRSCTILLQEQSIPPHARLARIQRQLRLI